MRLRSKSLPHFNERPEGQAIDTLVIHAMYAVNKPKPLDPLACIKVLDEHKLSAHYLISRHGETWRMVTEDKRAWQAGVSRLPYPNDTREDVNNFSIGVELVCFADTPYTPKQYQALAKLTANIMTRHPLKFVLGHEHIAPARKQDPGVLFDWDKYRSLVIRTNPAGASLSFGWPVHE